MTWHTLQRRRGHQPPMFRLDSLHGRLSINAACIDLLGRPSHVVLGWKDGAKPPSIMIRVADLDDPLERESAYKVSYLSGQRRGHVSIRALCTRYGLPRDRVITAPATLVDGALVATLDGLV